MLSFPPVIVLLCSGTWNQDQDPGSPSYPRDLKDLLWRSCWAPTLQLQWLPRWRGGRSLRTQWAQLRWQRKRSAQGIQLCRIKGAHNNFYNITPCANRAAQVMTEERGSAERWGLQGWGSPYSQVATAVLACRRAEGPAEPSVGS